MTCMYRDAFLLTPSLFSWSQSVPLTAQTQTMHLTPHKHLLLLNDLTKASPLEHPATALPSPPTFPAQVLLLPHFLSLLQKTDDFCVQRRQGHTYDKQSSSLKQFSFVLPSFMWPEVRCSICVVILIVQACFLCVQT